VVLAGALIGGGGWYFAGQIDADALAVQHPGTPQRDLQLVSLDGDQAVLRRTGPAVEDDKLRSPDEYGLTWAGGGGVLTGPATVGTGGRVTRTLVVTSGAAPAPGTAAALDSGVWTDPKAAYGVAYSDVTFPCAGGRCPAWFVPGTSSTWMVMIHGKGASRTEPLRALGAALHAGLPALDITYRNDAGAPQSGHYAYGATEWRDLEQAVGYAVDHGAEHVVLFGSSMGGAIVASFLEHSKSASKVRGLVLDAPALDFRAIVDWGAEHRTLPLIGTPIPGVLTATAEGIAGWRYGVDWHALDYLGATWLHAPALVFHGTADDTVPISTSDRFRADHPDLVREVRVPGATHVESWNVDPERYTATEGAFLSCVAAAADTPAAVACTHTG
jgi:pimeloyl-ACP methyl ester carboxylesterase